MWWLIILLKFASLSHLDDNKFKIFQVLLSAGFAGLVGATLVDLAGIEYIEMAGGLLVGALGVGNILLHMLAGMKNIYSFFNH